MRNTNSEFALRTGRHSLLLRLTVVLAAAVVFFTNYMLAHPAITLEGKSHCGIEAHTHTEDCYTPTLICGLEESEGTEAQYETITEPVLTCDREEHAHTEDCYDADGNLICGKEEHTHGESCYTMQETVVETAPAVPGHTHTDECYEYVLTCGKEEHEHVLQCYSDPEADTDATSWERAAQQAMDELREKGSAAPQELLLAAASSQMKYQESTDHYLVAEDGVTLQGYTIYGAAYGDPYGDWNAGFAAWCLDQAGISQLPLTDGVQRWMNGFAKTETPQIGNLVFFASDAHDSIRVGIITEIKTDPQGNATALQVLEGDCDGRVKENLYQMDDSAILSYGIVSDGTAPDDAADSLSDGGALEGQLAFTEELDEVSVCVYAAGDAFPEGTVMQAATVQSAQIMDAVEQAVPTEDDEAVTVINAVALSFTDSDGQEVQPASPIYVELTSEQIQAAVQDSESVAVVQVDAAAEIESESNAEQVSFVAEHAAVYAVVQTGTIEATVITADGETYQISVSCGPEAEIPEDAVLEVQEISEGTEVYQAAWDNTIRTLSDENGVAAVNQMRLFDISILSAGKTVEPHAPVQVSVQYVHPVPTEEDSQFQVVHFGAEETEVLEAAVEEPDGDEISSFQFETASFSTFAFTQANYIGSLNGQSFAIVKDNGSNKVAILSDPLDGTRLKGTFVNVLSSGTLTSVTAPNGTIPAEIEITVWTFEHVRDNLYYIKSDNGKYMNLTTSSLTVSDTPGLIEVYPIDSSGNLGGYIRLRCADNSSFVVSNKSGTAAGGFQSTSSTDGNTRFSLYASVENDVYPEITARKISAAELTSGNSYVIYQRVYNSEIGAYENYVVAGDGSLIYAFDDGDYVGFRTDKSTTWYLIEYTDETGEPTGYYDFYNAVTRNYLAPQQGSILSNEPLGVLLSGKGSGAYSTTIEGWDSAAWAYYGYQPDLADRVLTPGTGSESAVFSFAEPVNFETGELHTVETVDSSAAGIKISMYDFSNQPAMNLVGDDTWYKNGAFKQGLLQPVLGKDGLPVSSTGNSFAQIYNSSNYKGDANHLFLQSVYDATGYYEYNAFNNFAHYDQASGNFIVYEEMGIPKNGAGGSVSSYYRGNFLPYNNLDTSKPGTNTRLYDSLYGWVSLENPVFQDKMYLLKENADYHFGTIIEASFLQAKGGKDENGAPIIYEFMGDDDLWVYIDGVLVLDIGGIHSSVSGSINFSTGEVDAGGVKTTIKQAFKDARIFPDGTTWNDALVDDYFKGDTFNDYSGHTMKMFYQERGAGASTLKMRFNLPVIQSGTFAVEKQLGGTNQTDYANVQFAYQAFVKVNGQDVPLYPGVILSADGTPIDPETATDAQKANAVKVVYEGSGEDVPFDSEVLIGDQTYSNVFYLKPNEAAIFSGIPENVPYYVQEIDVSGAYFDTVMINDADMGGEGGTIPDDSSITAISSAKTIQQRQRVLFVNQCSPANMRDLRITKAVENPLNDGATFEFRVLLEGSDGKLTYYSRGDYYVVKTDTVDEQEEEHYYTYVNGVLTDSGTDPVVCSTSGQYGTIAGIPDGYTVVIRGLLAGTDFFVEEIRNPRGYVMVSKELGEGTYEPADLAGADGKIKLRTDAQVTITNHRYSTITVNKVWESGAFVSAHGEIKVALYERSGGSETLVEKGEILKSDAVQTITAPATSAVWYLELPDDGSLDRYVVREVIVDGDTVTPVDANGTIAVSGETTTLDSGATDTYAVTYSQGKVQTADEDNYEVTPYREDTITNTMPTLSVNKTDLDHHNLSGAEFQLLQADGKTVVQGYERIVSTSAQQGNLLNGIYLSNGTYYLKEIAAPAGYNTLTAPVKLIVAEAGVTYIQTDSNAGEPQTPAFTDGGYTVTISNNPGVELPMTGGMGTAWFYGLGGLIATGAAVLLMVLGRRRKA